MRRAATVPNDHLRAARLRAASTETPGEPMSRQELAERINHWIYNHDQTITEIDGNYLGKLERGIIRWPQHRYRQALRAILRANMGLSEDPPITTNGAFTCGNGPLALGVTPLLGHSPPRRPSLSTPPAEGSCWADCNGNRPERADSIGNGPTCMSQDNWASSLARGRVATGRTVISGPATKINRFRCQYTGTTVLLIFPSTWANATYDLSL
ncbi:hypothetical protein [Frankia sp. CiP3]|uniref:hypothetical protein n=1 Tax=Frankia sp. CiP3 TaxID=2880971 RepID=UPI001EF613B6|nr:hypothetical protein [Frankia sp. CiP3]